MKCQSCLCTSDLIRNGYNQNGKRKYMCRSCKNSQYLKSKFKTKTKTYAEYLEESRWSTS